MTSIHTLLTNTEHTLGRKRTTALVRQSWTTVIETEAQLNLIKYLRKELANDTLIPAPVTTNPNDAGA